MGKPRICLIEQACPAPKLAFGSRRRRIYVEGVRGERHHCIEAGRYDDIGDSIFTEQFRRLLVCFVPNLTGFYQLHAELKRGKSFL